MKRKMRFLGMLTVAIGLLIAEQPWTEAQGPDRDPAQEQGRYKQENERQRRQEREKEFLDQHKDKSGKPRQDLWLKGIYDFKRMKVSTTMQVTPKTKTNAPAATSSVVGVQWTQIGPQPLRIDNEQNFQGAGPDSGEVTDIAIDPRNTTDQVIYMSSNDGGIWKSTDGGAHWTPKTDYMPSNSMGAVALDPGNASTVYAGTGNAFNNGFFKGIGVYRSVDGGDTWTIPAGSSVFNGRAINRIVLPAANTLLVGASNGLFKSVDGGTSYGNNSPNFNNGQAIIAGNIADIDLDTTIAGTVYACVNGGGLRRSTDSGSTFGASIFDTNVPASFSYLSFAQSRAPDNRTMYVNMQVSGTPPAKIFKSTDGGATWAEKANGSAQSNDNGGAQTGYDQTIGVDPQDANRVYIGFQELYASTDGGDNFSKVSANQIHWDHHAIIFSPASHISGGPATRVWVGTDGGIHSSTNGGGTWANLNETIATNLFRHIDIGRGSSTNRGFTYGGCQDTGIVEHRPTFSGNDWHLARDGDGGQTIVDPGNPMRAYGVDNGIFITTTDAGSNWPFATSAASGLPDCGGNQVGRGCATPMAIDPNNSAVVYAISGGQLFQSTDTAATFTSIHTFSASVRAVSMTAIDSNTMWVGLSDGTVERTANILTGAFSTWTSHTVTGAPGQVVASPQGIVVDPSNTDVAVVVYPGFSGIGPNNRTKHVFRTTDNGATWTDISGTDGGDPSQNLPDLPLHAVVIDPGTSPHSIIVSSDAGVNRTANNGATWQILGAGLPIVDSTSLAIDPSADPTLLRVGTFGRSVFELTSSTGPMLAVNADLAFGTVCVGESKTRIVQIFNVGSSDLHISSFTRVSGSSDFNIISGPATPVTVPPGEEIDYTIRFSPSAPGNETATFQINSDDPNQPAYQLPASGFGGTSQIATLIANSGNFGDVCIGWFKDQPLTISNSGKCDLSVSNITSSSSQFHVAGVMSYPLVVHAGDSIEVPIRFQPTSFGAKTGSITISSNDPNSPSKSVAVSGNAPPGEIRVTGSTDFGNVCPGTLAEKTLSICNVGKCDLNVTSVAFAAACPDFTIVNNPFPATISPDSCLGLTIRFTPTSPGPKSCKLVINSDDPNNPMVMLMVTANTPAASIDVPPDQTFAPTVIQSIGACNTRNQFPISNTGTCNLKITNISIGGTNAGDYSIAGLPSFPIILQPGHIAGEGNLKLVFSPTAVSRERRATVSVTYESDPVAHTTTTITRLLCGEGVKTGARVLVTAGGTPINTVDKIQLQRINANRNKDQLDTNDVAQNPPLQTVTPTLPCSPFQFHREYGTVSNPIQLLPGSYQVTVQATIGKKKQSKTVGFDVDTCGFNSNINVGF